MTVTMTIVFLIGLGLLSYGAWLAFEPAGFIVGGSLLVLCAVSWVRGDRGAA